MVSPAVEWAESASRCEHVAIYMHMYLYMSIHTLGDESGGRMGREREQGLGLTLYVCVCVYIYI